MWRSLIYLDFEQGDKNGSVPLVENAVFYSLDGFHSFVKDQVTIGVNSFLGLGFYSTDLPVCLCTSTMQFLS